MVEDRRAERTEHWETKLHEVEWNGTLGAGRGGGGSGTGPGRKTRWGCISPAGTVPQRPLEIQRVKKL